MWAVKHKSGRVLFVTNCDRTANNRREMGWIVEEVKMTSREQFEAWAKTTNSDLGRYKTGIHKGDLKNPVMRKMWLAWQASRAAIEQGEVVAYQDFYGNAISGGDFGGGDDEMHETAFNEQWTPLIKVDGVKVKK